MKNEKKNNAENKIYSVAVEINPNDADSGSCFTNSIGNITVYIAWFFLIIFFPIAVFFYFVKVWEFQRIVIFRLGRVRLCNRGPGLVFYLPCVDDIHTVDLRIQSYVVEKQDLLTKDSVTISVDAVIFHRVADPLKATIKVKNSAKSAKLLAASTLRNILGTKNLFEILTERDSVSEEIRTHLEAATYPWGICVEIVEIKDVSLPFQLQRAMALEAEKSRESRAKVIAADGEKKASTALKDASDILSQSKAALELRYLQTLGLIAHDKSSIVVLPLPGGIMNSFKAPVADVKK